MADLPTMGLNFDMTSSMPILFALVFMCIIIGLYLYLNYRKYKTFLFSMGPISQFKITLEIIERRGNNAFGVRRNTRACKKVADERNFWILQDTGEWIPAPPLEYIMFGNHAKLYMGERGCYTPIVPNIDKPTADWKGFLSERDKEATLSRIKSNVEAFKKTSVLLQYAPVILSVITIAIIMVFVLVVGGSMSNVATEFKNAATMLGAAGNSCGATMGGAVVTPPAGPPV